MKRKYLCLLPAVLLALTLGGCKGGETPTTSVADTTEPPITVTESVQTAPVTDRENISPTDGTASVGTAATTGTAKPSADTSAAATTGVGTTTTTASTAKPTTEKPTTTKPSAAKPTTTKPTTTKPGAPSSSPAIPTTKPTTTKPSTTKPTTTKPTTTKPGTPSTSSTSATTKPGTTTAAPVAKGERITGRISYLNEAYSYKDKLTADKLKAFGLPADLQKDFAAHPDNYMVYSLDIVLENKEDIPVTLYYLEAANNGQNGIYINGDTSGDIGLPVGGKITNRFFVIAPVSAADGFVMSHIRDLGLRIRYAATTEDDTATPDYVYAKIG